MKANNRRLVFSSNSVIVLINCWQVFVSSNSVRNHTRFLLIHMITDRNWTPLGPIIINNQFRGGSLKVGFTSTGEWQLRMKYCFHHCFLWFLKNIGCAKSQFQLRAMFYNEKEMIEMVFTMLICLVRCSFPTWLYLCRTNAGRTRYKSSIFYQLFNVIQSQN